MEFTTTKRGSQLLCYDGYVYTVDKRTDKCTRWRCSNRSCKGFLYLDQNKNICSSKLHTCIRDEAICKKRIAINDIKNKIKTTSSPIVNIFTETTKNFSDDVLQKMPFYRTLRDQAVKQRNKINKFCITEMDDIPKQFQITLNNKKFLHHDSGVKDMSRFTIFFNEEFLEYIRNTHVWVVDGTFRSSPSENFNYLHFLDISLENIFR